MIDRYTLPEMGSIWSDEAKLESWKAVEVAVLAALEARGIAPLGVSEATRAAACPTPAEVSEREAITNHDLAAFVDVLGANTGGEAAGWIHYGLTSSDVLDTAGGLILSQAARLLLEETTALRDTIVGLAQQHQRTFMIGRTHGIWAEPTTFGLKMASWAFELDRDRERLESACDTVSVGKISGAVGTYAHISSEIEAEVCADLGLAPEPASTQVTARDRHAQYLSTVALGGSLGGEDGHRDPASCSAPRSARRREGFGKGQKGSSAMPHKRNPILSERMTGMARLLRGYAQVGLENVALWHERDISHSSAERVALPDASIALHYMLVKFRGLLENLVVDAERMSDNLESTRGLVFSQAVLLALVEHGLSRDEAYRIVQRNAMTAWDTRQDLHDLLRDDDEVPIGATELEECFSLERVVETSGPVFDRLSGLTQPKS